ncbi:MAG: hypothetical protein KAS32_28900 [Candidatus Peribacteraceae bacterium]|nr:hypothetical protein [Candidatus Peribacteraceae bacterium]
MDPEQTVQEELEPEAQVEAEKVVKTIAPPQPKKSREEKRHEDAMAVSDMNAAATRLEKANAETARLIRKQEQVQLEATFAGTASAGKPKKTEEDKIIDDAKALLKGTGFEEDLFPEK